MAIRSINPKTGGPGTILFIHCWLCGDPMEVPERDYTHGRVCGKC